jgi:predicted ATP-binding protein involved in virulence
MKIRELILSNYRAFGKEQIFPFGAQFAMVAGVNGRGKTAILDGLALLLSWFLRDLSVSKDRPRTIDPSEIHGRALSATLSMKLNCANIPIEYAVSYSKNKRELISDRLSPAVREQVLTAYGDPRRADDQAPLAVYYTTDRAGFRLPRFLPRVLPRGQHQAYDGALRARMVDYKELIARYNVWKRERLSQPMRAFDNALQTFLEEFEAVEVLSKPPRLTVRKHGKRLEPSQLSDGERSFVAVIGDLVRRLALANPELHNPLLGAGVVLIDELELHLHPKWQREVVEKLRTTFPNIQFIATTHSPFIIQSLRPGELINLDPEEFAEYADKSVEDIAENVMGVKLPQKSERFREMVETAETYFRLVRAATPQSEEERNLLRARLDQLSEPFSDDPAYVALLRIERETALGG